MSRLNLTPVFVLLIAVMSFLVMHYYGKYTTAQKDNKELSDVLERQDETIRALKGAADADRRATEEQLKIEQLKRAKADAENRTLRKALEHSDAGNQPLPDDVKRILRREDAAPTSAP
jgi:predicted RNase H-like nuclease (RuvC/YqgF family)